MQVDKMIYLQALKSCDDMEKEMESSQTKKDKNRVFMRYMNTISPRSKPTYKHDKNKSCLNCCNDDRYDVPNGNIWIWASIGISEFMYEKLINFATVNGIEYAAV